MNWHLLQTQLETAFSDKDIVDFEVCLKMGADALYLDLSNECIYEKALATHGCAEFVDICLQNGCSPHYINPITSKAAINCAAESADSEILDKLLQYPNFRVNCKLKFIQTAMHILVPQIDTLNKDNILACVQLLLTHGASPLLADGRGMTRLQYIMEHLIISQDVKNTFIEFLEANEDTHEAANILKAEVMEHSKLFIVSIVEKDFKTFDKCLSANAFDPNLKFNNKVPLDYAIAVGNYYALKKLLGLRNTDFNCARNPLIEIVKNWTYDSFDYRKCFYLLLKPNKIDVNAKDTGDLTALHYAAQNHNVVAMRELLKRGAFIGARSLSKILAVEGVPAEILQERLDNCVASNGLKPDDKRFGIIAKYRNLTPICSLEKLEERKFDEDLRAIKFIANSERHRHLLEHPVISSFLQLKWGELSYIFYAHFVIYLLFTISVCGYIVQFLGHQPQQSTSTPTAFLALSLFGIFYMVYKEFAQMYNEGWTYFRSPSNYIELIMIAMTIWTCGPFIVDQPHRREIAVATILLISVALFLLIGSIPMYSMTKHMLMFEAVCKSFLKSFMLYFIFFITFSLCFYILFGPAAQKAPEQAPTNFNRFSTPLGTVVKTIVMMTGEFDAASIDFSTDYSYILFLLYVFLVTIVLYNMLNGLAVSDIQAIERQAEQKIIISRMKLLSRYSTARFNLYGNSEYLRVKAILMRQQSYEAPSYLSGSDLSEVIYKKDFGRIHPRFLELCIDIWEQKKLYANKQNHVRSSENRLNGIESKLLNVRELLLKDIRERKQANRKKTQRKIAIKKILILNLFKFVEKI